LLVFVLNVLVRVLAVRVENDLTDMQCIISIESQIEN